MDETLRVVLIYGLFPLILGVGGFIVRTVMQRLSELEKQVPMKISEEQVRTLMSDKLDPLHEDIYELKVKLDKIVDLLLRK